MIKLAKLGKYWIDLYPDFLWGRTVINSNHEPAPLHIINLGWLTISWEGV